MEEKKLQPEQPEQPKQPEQPESQSVYDELKKLYEDKIKALELAKDEQINELKEALKTAVTGAEKPVDYMSTLIEKINKGR